ncbi:BolA family transcriptional regulator [Candidatus Gracilibacteria bacterium CG17_big_fil_post_rev_8_21_14_2_50_48_13]|nr:MAG: BolA family transcriptional regulator [Candidatus Gracilibacteria bacterium CG17_big_fil_post_rev_8_21_14_2_50_48_13]
MHVDEITSLLASQLPEATIVVKNPLGDGMHFHALLISAEFEGMPMLKRHRLVTNPLLEKFKSDEVHALSIKTYAPSELTKHTETLKKFGLRPESISS